jgi:hypothetical protein
MLFFVTRYKLYIPYRADKYVGISTTHRISNNINPDLGMDASVTPLPDQPGLSLVQTTDFFYPLVDDPYLQVRCLCDTPA